MAKHLNNAINQEGREIVLKGLTDLGYKFDLSKEADIVDVPIISNKPRQGAVPLEKQVELFEEQLFAEPEPEPDPDWRKCLLVISTKAHDLKQGEKVTGLDVERIKRLQEKERSLPGVQDVFVVFVDVRLKQCIGGFLSILCEPSQRFGMMWPMVDRTHTGEICYFHTLLVPTLFYLTPEQVELLGHLTAQNKVDKNQGYLFQ